MYKCTTRQSIACRKFSQYIYGKDKNGVKSIFEKVKPLKAYRRHSLYFSNWNSLSWRLSLLNIDAYEILNESQHFWDVYWKRRFLNFFLCLRFLCLRTHVWNSVQAKLRSSSDKSTAMFLPRNSTLPYEFIRIVQTPARWYAVNELRKCRSQLSQLKLEYRSVEERKVLSPSTIRVLLVLPVSRCRCFALYVDCERYW